MERATLVSAPRGQAANILAWLTVERALYGGLMMAALALRLARLGRAPLLAEELSTALAAWRALHGMAPGATGYAPLLLNAQVLLFALRSSPFAARLLPALVSTLLVGLPWLARERLGRVGALALSALVAFSPGWVYAGRTADGALLSVALAMAFFALADRYLRGGARRDARLAAVALAAGFAGGAALHTALTGVALAAALGWRRAAAEDRERVRERLREVGRTGAPALCAVAFVAIATGALLNLGGIGAVAELAGAWVRALAPAATELPWYHTPRVLAMYEPLILLLAAGGAYHGLRRRSALEAGLLLWLGYALLLAVALGHREPRWLLGTLLPLTLLAARGAQRLSEVTYRPAPEDVAPLTMGLVLVGFAYLQFAYYARGLHVLFALYGGFALGILALGLFGYGIWVRPMAARRLALFLLAMVLGALSVRGTAALVHDRARDPWEPLLYRPTSAGLAELEPLLAQLSLELAGDPRVLDVLYEEALDPWLAWALREFPNAHATVRVGARPTATVVITGPRDPDERPEGYVGRPFALWEEPLAAGDTGLYRLRWLLYRRLGPAIESEPFWVWVRMPIDG